MRSGPALAVVAALCGSPMFACGASERSSETPEPAAAQSREAQRAYRRLYARWIATPPPRRTALAGELRAFRERFPGDPKARFVRLYLAWLDVETNALDRALETARADRRNPPGSAGDLATVIEAAVLSRRHRADEALGLLEPLRGKIVDADDRTLFAGELVRAALGARRYGRALAYMLDWADQATGADLESVKVTIVDQVREIPPTALERALPELVQADASASANPGAQRWMVRTVQEQLIRAALARQDVALARRLLDTIPTSLRMDDTREALRELAARGRVAPRISGRSVGLVLELGGPRERQRSAEVAAGMSRALDLSRAEVSSGSVQLLSRESTDADAVEAALAALAGEGAAVLVAGVVAESAERARAFAERSRIPVVLLSVPLTEPSPGGFAFVVGEDERVSADVLDAALDARGRHRRVRVGPGEGVECQAGPVIAGEPRFPVAEWKKVRVDGLLLLGDRACATEVLGDVQAARLPVAIALGLEAAPLYRTADAPIVVAASAGRYPPPSDDIAASWFSTLGADVARLANATLRGFPLEQTQDDRAVAELHRKARDELARVESSLESTELTGFAGGRRLGRTLRAVDRGEAR